MILEDEGRATCQHYVPDAVQELPQASMPQRIINAHELRSEETHNALAMDLVQHAWSVRYISNDDEEEEEEGDDKTNLDDDVDEFDDSDEF